MAFLMAAVGAGLGLAGALRLFEANLNFGADGRGPGGCAADLLLVCGWVAGPIACGATAGALLALMLGSTLARTFHVAFGMCLGWSAPLVALLAIKLARLGGVVDVAPYERAEPLLEQSSGLMMLAGAVIAACAGHRKTGFSWRSCGRAWLGLIAGAALGAGVAIRLGNLWAISPWTYQEIAVIAIGATIVGVAGAAIGAIVGADRERPQGFAVLPVDTMADADAAAAPSPQLG